MVGEDNRVRLKRFPYENFISLLEQIAERKVPSTRTDLELPSFLLLSLQGKENSHCLSPCPPPHPPPEDIKGTQIELTPNQADALNNTNALKGCLRMICD